MSKSKAENQIQLDTESSQIEANQDEVRHLRSTLEHLRTQTAAEGQLQEDFLKLRQMLGEKAAEQVGLLQQSEE